MTRSDDRAALDADGGTDTRLGADQAGAPQPPASRRVRTKTTGVQLQARFDSWRAERRLAREARPPTDRTRTRHRAPSAFMAVIAVALLAASAVTGHRFEAARSENDARIGSLEGQVADAQTQQADTTPANRIAELAEAATKDADKVRDAQQTYATLYRQASVEPRPGNGTPNTAMIAAARHGKALAPLFDRTSYLVHDDAYSWHDVSPFDTTDKIDPRFPWYIRYDGPEASDPAGYVWKTETVAPIAAAHGAAAEATALWLCREARTGAVLAWASATYSYDGNRGAFRRLDVIVTPAGAQHSNPVNAPTGEPGDAEPDGPRTSPGQKNGTR